MHIHVPDGVLPPWLWGAGYVIALLFLFLAIKKVGDDMKRAVLTAAVSAMMLVAMSIPLGVPYHLNLTVLAGIMLGPWWSLIACFVVNGILASFGHGGITIVGLNTLITWIESLAGLFLYLVIIKAAAKSKSSVPIAAGISTLIALTFSAVLIIGVVAVSGINPAEALHHNKGAQTQISIPMFASLTLAVAIPGAVVEAIVTALILTYLRKVRPALFERR